MAEEGLAKPKQRKPYTLTKPRESWTPEEHERFIDALQRYNRDWKKIEAYVATKTAVQIRSHAQKYFQKIVKETGSTEAIPPPRPKRKSNAAAAPVPPPAKRRSSTVEATNGQRSLVACAGFDATLAPCTVSATCKGPSAPSQHAKPIAPMPASTAVAAAMAAAGAPQLDHVQSTTLSACEVEDAAETPPSETTVQPAQVMSTLQRTYSFMASLFQGLASLDSLRSLPGRERQIVVRLLLALAQDLAGLPDQHGPEPEPSPLMVMESAPKAAAGGVAPLLPLITPDHMSGPQGAAQLGGSFCLALGADLQGVLLPCPAPHPVGSGSAAAEAALAHCTPACGQQQAPLVQEHHQLVPEEGRAVSCDSHGDGMALEHALGWQSDEQAGPVRAYTTGAVQAPGPALHGPGDEHGTQRQQQKQLQQQRWHDHHPQHMHAGTHLPYQVEQQAAQQHMLQSQQMLQQCQQHEVDSPHVAERLSCYPDSPEVGEEVQSSSQECCQEAAEYGAAGTV